MTHTTKLTQKDVLHIADLAKLSLSPNERKEISGQLEETLDKIENLEELQTQHIPPTNSIVNLTNVFFTDGTPNTKGLTQRQALSQAHKTEKGQFVVEKIL